MISDEELGRKLGPLTDRLEAVAERFMDARDEFQNLLDSGDADRRARQLARDRLLDRAIDVEAAASDLQQLLRQGRDSSAQSA